MKKFNYENVVEQANDLASTLDDVSLNALEDAQDVTYVYGLVKCAIKKIEDDIKSVKESETFNVLVNEVNSLEESLNIMLRPSDNSVTVSDGETTIDLSLLSSKRSELNHLIETEVVPLEEQLKTIKKLFRNIKSNSKVIQYISDNDSIGFESGSVKVVAYSKVTGEKLVFNPDKDVYEFLEKYPSFRGRAITNLDLSNISDDPILEGDTSAAIEEGYFKLSSDVEIKVSTSGSKVNNFPWETTVDVVSGGEE